MHRHFVGRRQNLWDTNGSGGGSSLGGQNNNKNGFDPYSQCQYVGLRNCRKYVENMFEKTLKGNIFLPLSDSEPSSVSLQVIKRKRGWGVKLEAYADKIGDTFLGVERYRKTNTPANSISY